MQAMVTGLEVGPNDEVAGVSTFWGITFRASAVVLTTGTFMNGTIWVGRKSLPAGRAGEAPSIGLTESLQVGAVHSKAAIRSLSVTCTCNEAKPYDT